MLQIIGTLEELGHLETSEKLGFLSILGQFHTFEGFGMELLEFGRPGPYHMHCMYPYALLVSVYILAQAFLYQTGSSFQVRIHTVKDILLTRHGKCSTNTNYNHRSAHGL